MPAQSCLPRQLARLRRRGFVSPVGDNILAIVLVGPVPLASDKRSVREHIFRDEQLLPRSHFHPRP